MLIVTIVNATPIEISVLSALGVVPYLFLGFIVGALMDRWRRQRTLVISSVGRALTLAAIPILLLLNALNFWTLAIITVILGVLVLFAQSAEQALLPRIVPRSSLVIANARLLQGGTVAATAGPALGGVLLTLVGAPVLFALDALVNAVAAVLQSRIKIEEVRAPPRAQGRHIGHEIADGISYTYRHRTLRPLAISIHIWFLGNSIVATLFGVFVLRELDLELWAFGVVLTFGGVGGFLGALFAPRVGARLGAGRSIFLGRILIVVPGLTLAFVPHSGSAGIVVVVAIVSTAQFIYGLSMGIEDANDMAYRQSVAPDEMQGRMNSTIRTINRVVFFFGALLAGVLATYVGYRVTFGCAAVIFAAAAVVVLVSPLRNSRVDEPPSYAGGTGAMNS